MRWMRRASFLSIFPAVLALAGPAAAITIAPPGKAGANQYFETIPSSGGNVAPPSGGHGANPASLPGQGRTGAAKLARLGSGGAAAAALAAATAPSRSRPAGGAKAATATVTGSASRAGSETGAVTNVLTGSDDGGLGPVLPVLLASALIAAVGLAAARLRRRDPPELSA